MARASLSARVRRGGRVVGRAARVLLSRTAPRRARRAPDERLCANAMFSRAGVAAFETERRALQQFDPYLYDVMNSERLLGQIVFEYGTLLKAVHGWRGLRVLDVGTGRSSLVKWIRSRGAFVCSFDLPAPAERADSGWASRLDRLVARKARAVPRVAGTMRRLPFRDGSFDLVTSLSVVEHLDTDLPSPAYVPYAEQRQRLHEVLNEMVRVAAPGGLVYLTSECCDYAHATSDAWRDGYYCVGAPGITSAWPVADVQRLFFDYLAERRCVPVGRVTFRSEDIGSPDSWTFRGAWFSAFSVLARKLPE